ncbi:hypothetical protein XBO1_1610026 [Xenorhabdus bovienii str. oregonense]|uniref:Uncharacterized protein n=1 Tax=Xenorhabdus bovienii str. oregonense TaxID=1398202 RepID=A0A077P564_XENBV|nr:hypothetical protein XBO1_1610026 [Xenorhabdus bovienii str. oregonense]
MEARNVLNTAEKSTRNYTRTIKKTQGTEKEKTRLFLFPMMPQ